MDEQNQIPKNPGYPTGKKELLFGAAILLVGLALFNFTIWGGFNLGFAIAASLCILATSAYLLCCGCKLTPYPAILLALSLVICAGFARSDDGFVKFVMALFVVFAVNLALCLITGQNLRSTGSFSTLLDSPRALFTFGFGKISPAAAGISTAFRSSGSAGQKSGAILIGLLIAVPVLAVMIPLLMFADAAFEGLMDLLPEFDLGQVLYTVLWGSLLSILFYTRAVALRHTPVCQPPMTKARNGIHVFTVNTVLAMVCLLYGVYLFSQLAYVIGGFAGILPEEYTLADYARRGFYELAQLCTINLGIIGLSIGLVRKNRTAPLSTRLLCLFIGIITVFFVAASSGKMLMYIEGYGLTRLRLLTQVIMLWLGLTTVFVILHLFLPKFSYMRLTVSCAMVIGAVLLWTDVDTIVARYNVNAYLSGKQETVDVYYLQDLNDSAVPYLHILAKDIDPITARTAITELTWQAKHADQDTDWRSWNYASSAARDIWKEYSQDSIAEKEQENLLFHASAKKESIFTYVRQNHPLLEAFPYEALVSQSDTELVSQYLGSDSVVKGLLYDDQENIVGFDCGDISAENAYCVAGIFYSENNDPYSTGLNPDTFTETAPGYLLWENEDGSEYFNVEPILENWFYMEYYAKW